MGYNKTSNHNKSALSCNSGPDLMIRDTPNSEHLFLQRYR